MRIVFMGTPDFAVGSLQALCESGKHEIVGVVTQPDRPKGRGNKMLMTPVKEYALEQGLRPDGQAHAGCKLPADRQPAAACAVRFCR